MKFCQNHWEKLRAAIAVRGLDQFVAKSGEQVTAQQFDQLQRSKNEEDPVTKTNFDPLMGAHWAIVSNAMNLVGLDLMVQNEDGTDRCPLCFIQAEHDAKCPEPGCKQSYETWIEFASDDMLKEAKRLGLVESA